MSTRARAVACICAHGTAEYRAAAAGAVHSVLQLTDWEIVVLTDGPIAPAITDSPRVTSLRIAVPETPDRAARFLVKFEALERALSVTDAPLVVLLDADTRIVRHTTAGDVADALGTASIGMVEQTGIRGSDMDRARFLDHYREHALAFLDPAAGVPALEDFRFYNSGVVLGRRGALASVAQSALERIANEERAHVVGEHMIADQDYFQHWANALHPDTCTELGWEWNHCEWWDANFPAAGARVLHFSNFCLGPTRDALERMNELATTMAQPEVARVSAVVVTHQSAACIAACVVALRLAGADHIVVVDNASVDASAAIAEGLGCDVVRLQENHGFAVAANAGARLCRSPLIAFVNPDCIVDVDTLRRATALCDAEELVCAVPDFRGDDGVIIPGVQPGYTRRRVIADVRATRRGDHRSRLGRASNRTSWRWAIGACLIVGRRAFLRLGGFDEGYLLYMEDVDFGRRWCEAGGMVVSTGTIVEHGEQAGADVPNADRVRLLTRARLQFARSQFGPLTAWRVQWAARGIL